MKSWETRTADEVVEDIASGIEDVVTDTAEKPKVMFVPIRTYEWFAREYCRLVGSRRRRKHGGGV